MNKSGRTAFATVIVASFAFTIPAFAEQSRDQPSQSRAERRATQRLPLCINADPGERCRSRDGRVHTRPESATSGGDISYVGPCDAEARSNAGRRCVLPNGEIITRSSRNRRNAVIPEVEDEVLVQFEHGDPDRPVIIGRGGQEVRPAQPASDGFVYDRTYDDQITVGDELPTGSQRRFSGRDLGDHQSGGSSGHGADAMEAEETDEFGGQDLAGRTRSSFSRMEEENGEEDETDTKEPTTTTSGGTTTQSPSPNPEPNPEECEWMNPSGGPDQEECEE